MLSACHAQTKGHCLSEVGAENSADTVVKADHVEVAHCVHEFPGLDVQENLVHDFRSFHDLQVIRIGGLSFFFIPGEYFVEDGNALMKRSGGENCFIATVANGNGAYYPSAADMKRYPDIASYHRCQDKHAFGFYEIYGYPCRHAFKYQDHSAAFVADNLITLEELI